MSRMKWLVVLVLIVAGCVFGARFYAQSPYGSYEVSPDDPVIESELDQDWNAEARAFWYSATQGSRLLPLEWLEALEQAGSEDFFMEPEHVEQYNFLPRRVEVPNRERRAQLLVGMAIDTASDENFVRTKLRWKPDQTDQEPWVGLNCAACHTSKIHYKEHELRIEGGAALIDFQSFMYALNEALSETYSDEEKWGRFKARVLKGAASTSEYEQKLRVEFKKLLDWQMREADSNKTYLDYGYGRIDAFGHIYNKVALLVDDQDQQYNMPDAPVSIPFIWSAPQYNKVQYNGAAQKAFFWGVDVGALARNMGEFIGVFGDVVVKKELGQDGFSSSVDLENLYNLEKSLEHLRSPKWPESIFGPFDEEAKQKEAKLVARGRDLYVQNCALCHDVVDRTDTTSDIYVQENYFASEADIMAERLEKLPKDLRQQKIGRLSTDPWMACNAYSGKLRTGLWSSNRDEAMVVDFASIERGDAVNLGKRAEASKLLTLTVAGIMAANRDNLTEIIGKSFLNMPRIPRGLVQIDQDTPVINLADDWTNYERISSKAQRLEECMQVCFALSHMEIENNSLGYTSRPLNGIWATAPYLHNGSVPTLYDLLLPAHDRPRSFYMGSYEFDPVKVGYITHETDKNRFLFEARTSSGGPLNHVDGNINAGHDYGNENFSHDDRMAIIAYLKTL